MLNPLLRLALGDEAEKRLALEVEQPLLGDRRRMRDISSRHDRGQLAADQRIVIADAPGAPREMHAELERAATVLPPTGIAVRGGGG